MNAQLDSPTITLYYINSKRGLRLPLLYLNFRQLLLADLTAFDMFFLSIYIVLCPFFCTMFHYCCHFTQLTYIYAFTLGFTAAGQSFKEPFQNLFIFNLFLQSDSNVQMRWHLENEIVDKVVIFEQGKCSLSSLSLSAKSSAKKMRSMFHKKYVIWWKKFKKLDAHMIDYDPYDCCFCWNCCGS